MKTGKTEANEKQEKRRIENHILYCKLDTKNK